MDKNTQDDITGKCILEVEKKNTTIGHFEGEWFLHIHYTLHMVSENDFERQEEP